MEQSAETRAEIADPGRGNEGLPADHRPPAKVDLKFRLLFGALCHDAAETNAMRKHRSFTAFSLILGSGAAVAIGAQYPVAAQAMALLVAIVGAIQLVWDFGKVARDHALLRQRYYELLADLERGKDEREVSAAMTSLFGTEPPVNARLQKLAHNRAARSLYGEKFNRA